jgi:protein-S-isoprenylcysteine O-methyltransferase Ste14
MSNPDFPKQASTKRVHLPLWLCAVLGAVVVTVIYPLLVIALPWALSLLTPRFGWRENGPAVWNLPGLIPVVLGIAGLIWVFGTMFAQMPKLPNGVDLEKDERLWSATARVLVTHGPFALSRNPMFLSGLTVWFGWSLYYGSAVVFILSIALWALTNYITIPSEERKLEARFGDVYSDYKKNVSRWFGRPRRA